MSSFALFLGNPFSSAVLGALMLVLLGAAWGIKTAHGVGRIGFLGFTASLWMLNAAWEWTRLFKFYDIRFDIWFTYPLLLILTLASVFIWGISVFKEIGIVRGNRLDLGNKPAFTPERLINVGILIFACTIGMAIMVGMGAKLFGANWNDSFIAAGCALIAGVAVSAIGILTLQLSTEKQSVAGAAEEIKTELEAIDDCLIELTLRVQRFDHLAVHLFHAIDPSMNDVYTVARQLHMCLTRRTNEVRELMAVGSDIGLAAAREHLREDLDLRKNFMATLISRELNVSESIIPYDNWRDVCRTATAEMDVVLSSLQSLQFRAAENE